MNNCESDYIAALSRCVHVCMCVCVCVCERESVPGLECVDPAVKWQTFGPVLFGPDGIGQETGDTMQMMFHSAACERCCQLGLTPVTITHTAFFKG